MTIDQLREYALGKPDTEETLPFGPDVLVMKVLGKVFLLISLDTVPVQFNAKCDPERAIELREQYASILPGYHMNKQHWNTIILDGSVPMKLVRELIDHSYELVAKKKATKKTIDILFVGRIEAQKNLVKFVKIIKNISILFHGYSHFN